MQAIEVVVGGQYGSEAKGHITAQLVKAALDGRAFEDATVINVRVAGPNAGHTVYDADGNKFAFRQIPVGAVISDEVICYIAPGSEIDVPVLLDEIALLRSKGHAPSIIISGEATVIEDRHKHQEEALVHAVGSTGKGIGAARADRLFRGANRIKDNPQTVQILRDLDVQIAEPHSLYSSDMIGTFAQQHIIVEGTQGFGLGLHAGHYPQVTSSDCTAADFLAMAGLSVWRSSVVALNVWVVCRAFPIRVAGNSGPLADETTWEALGLPEERTTVTQKVRRVGGWDSELVARAVQANGGAHCVNVALTMADQKIREIAGFDGTIESIERHHIPKQALEDLAAWVRDVEDSVGARVRAITTSPTDIAWISDEVQA